MDICRRLFKRVDEQLGKKDGPVDWAFVLRAMFYLFNLHGPVEFMAEHVEYMFRKLARWSFSDREWQKFHYLEEDEAELLESQFKVNKRWARAALRADARFLYFFTGLLEEEDVKAALTIPCPNLYLGDVLYEREIVIAEKAMKRLLTAYAEKRINFGEDFYELVYSFSPLGFAIREFPGLEETERLLQEVLVSRWSEERKKACCEDEMLFVFGNQQDVEEACGLYGEAVQALKRRGSSEIFSYPFWRAIKEIFLREGEFWQLFDPLEFDIDDFRGWAEDFIKEE